MTPQGPDQDQMMLDYLMEMGALQPQQDALTHQRGMANQLRQQGAQAPGMRDSGRMMHAAHPLEFLSQMANTGAGVYKDQQANQMQDKLGADKRAALAGMRARMQPQQQQQQQPVQPYDPYAGQPTL